MKCTLDGNNAKIIAKAVQSLSKFGSDLFVEADVGGLQLRSLNTTRSAVGTFKFSKNFFDSFQVDVGSENYCKISMKACLTIFRNMKQVEHCEISILAEQSKFQVKLKCRLDTLKNALITIVDEENISATVSVDDMINNISASHKIFTEISNNFNIVEEEITLEAHKTHLTVKNYVDGTRVHDKFMRSQLKMNCNEFDKYRIQRETTVTFCLKEFRAFLSFAETINENLDLSFDEAGSPLFIRIKKFDIECILIMSTLSSEDMSIYDDCRDSVVLEPNSRLTNRTPSAKRKMPSNTERESRSAARKRIAEATTLSNDSSVFRFNDNPSSNSAPSRRSPHSIELARNFANEQPNILDNNVNLTENAFIQTPSTSHKQLSSEVLLTYCDTEENEIMDQECIPQSPEHAVGQVRNIFSRCFERTYVPKQPSPSSQAFVPDSDTED